MTSGIAKLRWILWITVAICLTGTATVWAEGAAAPSAVFPERSHEFTPVREGTEIKHDFIIENRGPATLEIKGVRPD